jgi:hypothetical protein
LTAAFDESTVARRSLDDLPDGVELSAQLAVLAFKRGHTIAGRGDVALEDRNAAVVSRRLTVVRVLLGGGRCERGDDRREVDVGQRARRRDPLASSRRPRRVEGPDLLEGDPC